MKIIRLVEKLPLAVIDVLFPNRCVYCGRSLEESSCICQQCIDGMEIIQGRCCSRCGAPGMGDNGCSQCSDFQFLFEKNESLGVFSGRLRELIHMYKFNRRSSLGRMFSKLLVTYKSDYIKKHDILLPVPLTLSRLSQRGFNQSYLVAKHISDFLSIQFGGNMVLRKGSSRPQSSIKVLTERLNNVTDRFILRKNTGKYVTGRNILLLDDVLTTGATASGCARVLYRYRAANVDLLTIARAMKGV
ncbi:MAG: ComF family protein [Spirochaetota bacterium]